jgi:hypothetical protein
MTAFFLVTEARTSNLTYICAYTRNKLLQKKEHGWRKPDFVSSASKIIAVL